MFPVVWDDLLAEGAQPEVKCFEIALQPWREWPGDAPLYDSWRRDLAGVCRFRLPGFSLRSSGGLGGWEF